VVVVVVGENGGLSCVFYTAPLGRSGSPAPRDLCSL
jgi:hypothetical protein